ncbi:MAG: MBL fold metallo-hydrolase [Acidobacteria bacterium]|nr:MBL fold metallo-hydrolase [Acidobacteriota bacterium]
MRGDAWQGRARSRQMAREVAMLFLAFLLGIGLAAAAQTRPATAASASSPFVVVLGIAQDGGYPQAGCSKACCKGTWTETSRRRSVASLAIVDPGTHMRWLIDATPDFREQLRRLDEIAPAASSPGLEGIFLTHGHIGHYTGLMQLGREVMGAKGVPVYAMPRMRKFLETSGPWDQLVKLGNITLRSLDAAGPVILNSRLSVTPLLVPHRDEYTETVGFVIRGPSRAVLYLPDIDKWDKWSTPLAEALSSVDVAYLDGTFHGEGEIPGRNMAEIPHPFMVETLELLQPLPPEQRAKVRFIHLNHTNPALNPAGNASRQLSEAGLLVAVEGERIGL